MSLEATFEHYQCLWCLDVGRQVVPLSRTSSWKCSICIE